jgi:hypothetical protein
VPENLAKTCHVLPLTQRNLTEPAAERGDLADAKRLWEAVLAECPGDRQALVRLSIGQSQKIKER